MNNKKRISIKIIILTPVFVLGLLAILSNMASLRSLKRVNRTAVTIADVHMANITELSTIEKEVQEIHKIALSHIIATDFDTLIRVVDEVRAEEDVLDQYLETYKEDMIAADAQAYEKLVSDYEAMKYEIANHAVYIK